MGKTLGVVNLPRLVDALRAYGVEAVTGDDFKQAAKAISQHNSEHGVRLPILVGDDSATPPVAAGWLMNAVNHHAIAVVSLAGASGLAGVAGVTLALTAPAKVADLLLAIGAGVPDAALAGAVLAADGIITLPAAPEPAVDQTAEIAAVPAPVAPAEDFWPEEDDSDPWATPNLPGLTVPSPALAAAPEAEPAPGPTPIRDEVATATPAPSPAEDSWSDDEWGEGGEVEDLFAPSTTDTPAPAVPSVPEVVEQVHVPEAVAEPAAHVAVPAALPVPSIPAALAPEPEGPVEREDLVLPDAPYGDYIPAPSEDMFAGPLDASRYEDQTGREPCPVILSIAGKGGVGKTLLSVATAQAGGREGLRVALVDGNVGQGDVLTFMRLHTVTTIPTIYDAAASGDPRVALTEAEAINRLRDVKMGEIQFAIAPAAPKHLADPSVVSWQVYKQVIDFARARADLVIIDTQISEVFDQSGMFDRLFIPMMKAGAWVLASTDTSREGVENLLSVLGKYAEAGVRPDRVMIAVNLANAGEVEGMTEGINRRFSGLGTFVGLAVRDNVVHELRRSGTVPDREPSLAPLLRTILHRVTRRPEFAPLEDAAPSGGPSLWKRLTRRGA